jgi:uncharacterized protein YdeI (YjbR/CyaY-like superfamily)
MPTAPDLPVLRFESPAAWETWLAKHHATSAGLWLEIAKKEAGVPSVSYAEALDVALCYGWIDGQKGAVDAHFWRQRFTPRTPRSRWSKINCAKVETLIAQGRMQPAGLRMVEAAKSDGRWEAAYDSPRTATMHEDLVRALDASPEAKAFYATLNSANRYLILYRVQDAKKPETRARRIAEFVAMLARNERPLG